MRILCSNPHAQFLAHAQEIEAAISKVLRSGHYINGPEVSAFESEFAAWNGASHGVSVASGTDALRVVLSGLGIGPSDEVITVSLTAVATVAAIELTGATPRLVDIDPVYGTLDPAKLEAAVSKKTKAVIVVHLYGQPADLDAVSAVCAKYKIPLIEDCAQAHGARYQGARVGNRGIASCFSFYPTKNLGAIGDGGMILTSNAELAAECRLIREYGWKQRYISARWGLNSRLDELQAAVLRVKLKYLDSDNDKRRAVATQYMSGLAGLPLALPSTRPGCESVYHLYVVQTPLRNLLKGLLEKAGVFAGVHYPAPVHLQPAYRHLTPPGGLGATEKLCEEVLSLPMYPELSALETSSVIEAVRSALRTRTQNSADRRLTDAQP